MSTIQTPTLSTLAVVSQSGESISFFDIDTGKPTGKVSGLLPEPHELCYDDRHDRLYVSHAYAHGWYGGHGESGTKISVLDSKSRKVIHTIDISPTSGPHYLALDKERDILYSSVEGGIGDASHGGIIGIDISSQKVIKTIGSEYKSHWFVMTPDGAKAYTCNKEAGFISVIDLLGEKMTGKIDLPGGCEQPGISNDGKLAYFPTPSAGVAMKMKSGERYIQVVDTASDQKVRKISLEYGPLTVYVDSKDRLLVGHHRFDAEDDIKGTLKSRLTVLAPRSGDFRKLGDFETDSASLTVFASADGRRAFASNILSGTVTVIDLEKMVVERTLEVDTVSRKDKSMHAGAHGLAIIA